MKDSKLIIPKILNFVASGDSPGREFSIFNSRRGVGFTLLEVMISLAIIGGLLVTLIYTLNYHISVIEKHEAVTIASLLAREKITEGRKLLENKKGAFPEPYSAYSYETSIRESSSPGISEISVAVKRDRDEVRFSELVMSSK